MHAVDEALGWITAAALFVMMTLTFVDVLTRAAGLPVKGAFEIVELLLLVLVFTSIPLASRWGQHIIMDLLPSNGKHLWQKAMRVAAELLISASLFGIAYLMYFRAARVKSEGTFSAVLHIPYWPFVSYMVVMMAIMGAVHLFYALSLARPVSFSENSEGQHSIEETGL